MLILVILVITMLEADCWMFLLDFIASLESKCDAQGLNQLFDYCHASKIRDYHVSKSPISPCSRSTNEAKTP